MQLLRMFSNDKYKGTRDYLKTQKKYEILRTVIYFGISLSLFMAGYIATGDRINLLTIVAILGCLPASKSAVEMIMFLRAKGCSGEIADEIVIHQGDLSGVFDLFFTSYDKNYQIAHMVVKGNTVCGYSQDEKFEEQAFYKHIGDILKADNYRETSVKVFKDLKKYTERMEQLQELETDESNTEGIIHTLKSVSL
uniref:hypothetical protein n=1 Tax=Acetatifactor sp. TaxID=1872090 RepID=UPI0040565E76